jgi:hypothetical protein
VLNGWQLDQVSQIVSTSFVHPAHPSFFLFHDYWLVIVVYVRRIDGAPLFGPWPSSHPRFLFYSGDSGITDWRKLLSGRQNGWCCEQKRPAAGGGKSQRKISGRLPANRGKLKTIRTKWPDEEEETIGSIRKREIGLLLPQPHNNNSCS